MAAIDNLNGVQFTPVTSDSGSLLDADLPAMGDADHLAPTIGALHQAHADAVAGVQAARGAFPAVTQLSDFGDRLTGAGHAAGRAAIKGAGHVLRALDELKFPPAPDVDAMSRQIRGTYRPGA